MREPLLLIAGVVLLLLVRQRPQPKPLAIDFRSQVAGWLAYYAVNTPKPAPKPKVETPKPKPPERKPDLKR